jgi:hypothetical protein
VPSVWVTSRNSRRFNQATAGFAEYSLTTTNHFETEEEIKDVDGTNIAKFNAAGLSLAFAPDGSSGTTVSLFRVRGRDLRRVQLFLHQCPGETYRRVDQEDGKRPLQ